MIFPVNNRIVLQLNVIIQAHHHHSFYLLQYFTFSTQIMVNLKPSDANDLQVLMSR